MTPPYIIKLGIITWKTDINAPKINGLGLVTYEIVIVGFLPQNKVRKTQLFEKTFLLV